MTETTLPSAADDLAALSPSDGTTSRTMSGRLKAAGIVGTAVALGFVGVLAVQGSSASPGAASSGPPGVGAGAAGPGGRLAGLSGTVEAISGSSITVGGTTVKVTSATQVVGGSLSDVTKGLTVFVHTEGTGDARFAERIFVGTMSGPGGGPGFGPPPGQQPPTGNGTTSST